jgi:hypothetical protein
MQYAKDDMGKPLIPDAVFTGPGMALARKFFTDAELADHVPSFGGGYVKDTYRARELRGEDPENSTFASKNASIFDPPNKPLRAFEADYPNGAMADESGRLTHDIDGRPITAKTVVGRRMVGGEDEAFSPAQLDALSEALFGNKPEIVASREIGGDAGRFKVSHDTDGNAVYQPFVSSLLTAEQAPRVAGHEIAHGIDYFGGHGRTGIPTDGLSRELGTVYHDLNDASWRRGQPTRPGLQTTPESFGYKGENLRAENMAEAIRSYMADPNYIKTIAPKTAERIRQYVNDNPRLSGTIQFNSDTGKPSLMGSAIASASEQPKGITAYYESPHDFDKFSLNQQPQNALMRY